jgi:equilibrative nucleoside transporter 1/2/3
MLIYTTATAATSSKTYRIRASSVILAMLFLVLTLSTMSGASGTSYFTLIMGIDACLALAASVLNTTVVALAALFGPGAMQACFAGQAAVGVIVSAVQFLGAFFSDADSNPSGGNNQTKAGPAAIFFGLSMAFVLLALIAHSMLLRTPEYADVRRWEAGKVLLVEESGGAEYSDEDDAEQDVHSNMLSSVDDLGVEVPQVKGRVNIWEVAKINQSYNLAVGFCFAVTLVSRFFQTCWPAYLIIVPLVCFPTNHGICCPNKALY